MIIKSIAMTENGVDVSVMTENLAPNKEGTGVEATITEHDVSFTNSEISIIMINGFMAGDTVNDALSRNVIAKVNEQNYRNQQPAEDVSTNVKV